MDDKIFRRTQLGDAEIRQRSLSLSKSEQLVLLSVDGERKLTELHADFAGDQFDFLAVFKGLVKKNLVTSEPRVVLNIDSELMAAQIENFNSDEFFSSSMDPLHTGSGLVVDTRTNSLRSVNLKKRKQSNFDDVDIPLSLELDTELRKKKEKRSQKLVQVFPNPEKKRRKRSRRVKQAPVSKWPLRISVAVIFVGVVLVLIALFL
ncbi:hypothetical protein [Undibacterium fentianense]|uniref:Uncharacterized protein n=1 Tax=Undibacterium fentianense TaxID=2828728 RepID=A0A941E6D4_9BURK|nr:hypothetical protein [Undibacterium fentianense]MBR7800593.1 hypothetical protein [Undibacterium fentianense]